MSLQTWKEEFYKEEACVVPKHRALAHSLTKWKGLTKRNLAKHKVCHSPGGFRKSILIDGKECFRLDGTTCALCNLGTCLGDCDPCPLFLLRHRRCDVCKGSEEESPWHMFINFGDPKPMIRLITRAIKKEKGVK